MNIKPDYIIDLRGAIPPITLLKVSQVFRDMKIHEVLEILCRDPDTRCDLFKVLPQFSYEVLVIEELADKREMYIQSMYHGMGDEAAALAARELIALAGNGRKSTALCDG